MHRARLLIFELAHLMMVELPVPLWQVVQHCGFEVVAEFVAVVGGKRKLPAAARAARPREELMLKACC
jgi:hypothetical protein